MKKIWALMLIFTLAFFVTSCEQSKKQYLINPYIKTVKEKYNVKINKQYFVLYINPKHNNEYYSKIDINMIMGFDKLRKIDECNSADWLGISYVETSIGHKLIIFPKYIGLDQELESVVEMVDYYEEYQIEFIEAMLKNDLKEISNSDENDIVFVGASSFYTTNEFDCGSNSNGDFVFSNSNYSKLLNPEKLNKESFVLYFRGKLKNKDDLEKVWISLDDYVQYRVWYTEEGLFITESGKKISERYIYPYVSDVEKKT